jgi:hypothetical protein
MTDYKTLHGQKVKAVASDPSPLYEGQIWYNTGDSKFRVRGIGSPTFTEGGDLTTARDLYGGGCGVNTAALAIAGYTGSETPKTEEFNGTAWSEQTDMGTVRYQVAGCGIQTAALAAGGIQPPAGETEEYNGSAWSEQGDLNTPSHGFGLGGTQTSAIRGGSNVAPKDHGEEYNGSSWSEVSELNTGRHYVYGTGANAEAAIFAGSSATASWQASEEWNGSAWSEGNNLNTGRTHNAGFFGIQTLAYTAGGTPAIANVEEYNGTSWAETTDINTGRAMMAGGGTSTDGCVFGGNTNTTRVGNTELFEVGGPSTQDVTSS